jgi:two-component system KDP operon response regulator KdpE
MPARKPTSRSSISLPDRDGIDFIREVRAFSTLPILVLSAHRGIAEGGSPQRGADDYPRSPSASPSSPHACAQCFVAAWPGDSPIVEFGDVAVDLATAASRVAAAQCT